MQVTFGEKLKLIRNSLGLNQADFSDMVDIGLSSYKKYEAEVNGVGAPALQKVASHPQCIQYALWLLTDTTNVEAGQISPGDSLPKQEAKQQTKEQYEMAFKAQVEETMFMFCSMEWFKMAPDVKLSDVGVIMLNKLQPIIDQQFGDTHSTSLKKMA